MKRRRSRAGLDAGPIQANREISWPADRPGQKASPRGRRILALLMTLGALILAAWLGRAMWDAYMVAPWTRDGAVRAYVVTMAPEVSGRIVGLPVTDNMFVHKGDALMVIDPTNYGIAVRLAETAVEQANANMQNAQREAERRRELPLSAVIVEQQET